MGAAASIPAAPGGSEPPSRPSTSRLNPTRNTSRSFMSYFLPISTPDLTHDHLPPFPADIDETISALSPPHLPLLPPEIVYQILDLAEYWLVCRRMSRRPVTVVAGAPSPRLRAPGNQPGSRWLGGQEEEMREEMEIGDDDDEEEGEGGLTDREGEVWYLVSSPIGCAEEPAEEDSNTNERQMKEDTGERGDRHPKHTPKGRLRRVVIETLSRDQGWSSHAPFYGTYEQSYSWFELSLLRSGKEVPNSRISIQNNVHAGQYLKAHVNVLEIDHPFVRMARPGDRIVLWARAQFPGWRNYVSEAAITVYSAPSSFVT
ncbi:hypothetical protein BCR39DRAFT_548198 [Naematelia encephala]|uniref:Uncharacterized protein n=1 Tax=Naematelia encephala TaxID=71784 RepID=A0A1Y2AP01_9TREE|nr:hypothetical protein BCR39DRAFT_548198 [Naematelia encephala]